MTCELRQSARRWAKWRTPEGDAPGDRKWLRPARAVRYRGVPRHRSEPPLHDPAGPLIIEDLTGLQDRCRRDGLTLEVSLDATGSVAGPAAAGRVLHELVHRACADAPRGGRIRASTRDLDPAGEPGARPGRVEFLLEAAASTSSQVWGQLAAPLLAAPGSGDDGPRLEVGRTSGKGTTLRLQLPCAGRASSTPGSGPVVLVADDDALIRDALAGVLREQGYSVLAAENGEAALERIAELGRPIDLVVADIMMPRMSGIELARRLAARRPAVKVLFLSALPLPRGAVLPGPLVPKPLDLGVLLHQVPGLVASLLRTPVA